VLRLLSKRNADIGRQRSRVVSRLHPLLVELAPGGIAREINVSAAQAFLESIVPASPAEQTRYDLARDWVDDICRLDVQLKESHKRIANAVKTSSTSLTDLFGVGPIADFERIPSEVGSQLASSTSRWSRPGPRARLGKR